MKTTRVLGLISGAILLLGAIATDASAAKLVYRTQILCDGGGHGLGLVHTLIVRDGHGFGEPFFRITARLSDLPDLPVTSCQATLECQDLPDVTLDCTAAIDGARLDFVGPNVFSGVLLSICRRPAVRVDFTYPGGSGNSCVAQFL